MAFKYGREIQKPAAARRLEFLMAADHAYCSSSVGGNTRKYHGLFVDHGRLQLAGLDEIVNGVRISAQQYQDGSDDAGLLNLHAFSAYPPRWTYMVGDVTVQKTVSFDGNLSITYDIIGNAELRVRPLITDRSVNEVVRIPCPPSVSEPNGVRWGELFFESDLPFDPDPVTYWNVWYEQEHERGYEPVEDLYSPGFFSGPLRNGKVTFQCTRNGHDPVEKNRILSPQSPLQWMDRASDAFCHGDEIFAGYHWFCESWGRDSAISITGLLIERDQKAAAQAVLRRLASGMKDGIIPNRFPDNYHTSDASLWFIHALVRYRRRWGDDRFIGQMRPVISDILNNYVSSPVASIDGSLISVVPKSTWMDTGFTPREGKPVEINALWVNALTESEAMGIDIPVTVDSAQEAFKRFWNKETQCLFDRIDPVDPSIRPNQVVALALGLVDQDHAAKALDAINKNLLTPYGLRTLSPRDPHYEGRYSGDRSYHNGCVWPWLTGWYVDALIRNGVRGDKIQPLLIPILHHLREAGMGYISEIFDGDPPYIPRGCIAQAWSVAEISRACRMVFY
ncbi:MAG: glycogen debranching enzyme N-terminal domain-containing protein [Methanoregula sp.]|nr:MAG: glycogen debranching enzyme N-terminal domain-containing protein [Methanoregula sp.]